MLQVREHFLDLWRIFQDLAAIEVPINQSKQVSSLVLCSTCEVAIVINSGCPLGSRSILVLLVKGLFRES